MTTRRKFIKNTVVGAALVYVSNILAGIKATRIYKSKIGEEKDTLYAFQNNSIDSKLTDNFFDSI